MITKLTITKIIKIILTITKLCVHNPRNFMLLFSLSCDKGDK